MCEPGSQACYECQIAYHHRVCSYRSRGPSECTAYPPPSRGSPPDLHRQRDAIHHSRLRVHQYGHPAGPTGSWVLPSMHCAPLDNDVPRRFELCFCSIFHNQHELALDCKGSKLSASSCCIMAEISAPTQDVIIQGRCSVLKASMLYSDIHTYTSAHDEHTIAANAPGARSVYLRTVPLRITMPRSLSGCLAAPSTLS